MVWDVRQTHHHLPAQPPLKVTEFEEELGTALQ